MTVPRSENTQPIDRKLLELLVCPVTRKPLVYDQTAGELISESAGLAYPIRHGIPIMLADEARKIEAQKPSKSNLETAS
ncbi:MAG: Trm112 family protein [Alphaproteobacteria bacterium]|nr:Trm112 family protein [Alphaproteobacteria bacterium]OJV46353.1 MAG: hypothetical protein BGO28_03250 [Alphaproteobacteria bacterium 43-37]